MKVLVLCYLFCLLLSACSTPSTILLLATPSTSNPPGGSATPATSTSIIQPSQSVVQLSPTSSITTFTPIPFLISSSAFENNKPIPIRFSCEGENISPHLKISGVPKGSTSLALVMDDPDAPGGTYTHWVLYNLQPSLSGLNENVIKSSEVQGLGSQGLNSSSRIGYFGPCPPSGTPHRYFFKIFALDLKPNLPAGLNSSRLMDALKGHILAQTEWMGTYQRK